MSLQRDTPVARAALARRRQRAAAVVENSSRFSGTPSFSEGTPDGGANHFTFNETYASGNETSSNSKQSNSFSDPSISNQYGQFQQRQDVRPSDTANGTRQEVAQRQPPLETTMGHNAKPSVPGKGRPELSTNVDASADSTFVRPPSSTYRYTASTLPSSEELLKRSSKVAEAAASVLASARKHTDKRSSKIQSKTRSETGSHQKPPKTQISRGTTVSASAISGTANASNSIKGVDSRSENVIKKEASGASPMSLGRFENKPVSPKRQHRVVDETTKAVSTGISDEEDSLVKEAEDVTWEELEPSIDETNEVLDGACLYSGSWVMVRSGYLPQTLVATADDEEHQNYAGDTEHFIASLEGFGLGKKEEYLQIRHLHDSNGSLYDSDRVLRMGDTVALFSSFANDRVLGFRKYRKNKVLPGESDSKQSIAQKYQVGFFRSTVGRTEQWTIIRGGTHHPIRVGLAALRATGQEQSPKPPTAAVRSGNSVLLRNCQTGGLLAFTTSNLQGVEIVTDSYDSSPIQHHNDTPSSTSKSLMGRLQSHDRFVPTNVQTFVLLKVDVPPCPTWIFGDSKDRRMYLQHSYLTKGERFDAIGESDKTGNFDRMTQSESKAQERLLIDELIGSFLGLEGRFIKIKQVADSESTKLEFVLEDGADFTFLSYLRGLAEKILPLSTAYVRATTFVASHLPGYEYGNVMQAFCQSVDTVLQDFASFVAQLNEQFRLKKGSRFDRELTLQHLQVQVWPSLHSLQIIEQATVAVSGHKGGALIKSLARLKARMCEGDPTASRILHIILQKSSAPLMGMLKTWLQYGVLRDPHNEFMIAIVDPKEQTRGDEEVYLVREDHLFDRLSSTDELTRKILATGKYWRAVRACKMNSKLSSEEGPFLAVEEAILRNFDVAGTSSYIHAMYQKASEALVSLLMNDFKLMDSLRSMKRFFLLDQGDFLVHFLDAAEDELGKELPNISNGRIQHWLRMAVQLTEQHGEDDHKWNEREVLFRSLNPLSLRGRFEVTSLIEHLDSLHSISGGIDPHEPDTPSRHAYGWSNKEISGIEAFTLEFPSVPFPISLVLSERALGSYQLLFRLLFFAKHVERRLVGIWQDHQAMKQLNTLRGSFGATFLLRQRMLHFSQNLIYYIMFEVIEPNWLEMEKALIETSANRRTVDDIVGVHDTFLDKTLEACLLTNRDLLRTLTKLLTTCLLFADQMKLFMEATRIHDDMENLATERRRAIQRSLNDRGAIRTPHNSKALRETMNAFKKDRQIRLKNQMNRIGRELSSESYKRMVARFDEVFSAYLSEFMVQLNSDATASHQDHKTNLCTRLDYNGFLSMGTN